MARKKEDTAKLRTFRMPEADWNALKFVARIMGVSISDIIRDGIKNEINKIVDNMYKKGNNKEISKENNAETSGGNNAEASS